MLKLPNLSARQLDGVNIGLMVISLVLAYILPFELFLFSYAVLGPLHYLTEISWLHQRKYFVPSKKNDFLFFAVTALILGLIISWPEFSKHILGNANTQYRVSNWGANIIFVIFALALIMVALKKTWMRILAIVVLMIINLTINFENSTITCTHPQTQKVSTLHSVDRDEIRKFVQKNGYDTNGDNRIDNCSEKSQFPGILFFFSAYLPTLVHVYLFTMLFMLFGALKSGSRLGLISVVCLVVCGITPFLLRLDTGYEISQYARGAYDVSFYSLNQVVFTTFKLGDPDQFQIYFSPLGIALTRFIAFAYTYHYLNWFSKTSIIQWHKMRLVNLVIVLLLWVTAVGVYLYDYETGLAALFFLSFLHVFMEFPLNFHTIVGIGKSLFGGKQQGKVTAKTV